MSTSTTTSTSHPTVLQNWQPFAVISSGLAAVLTAIGTFWSPLADYEATRSISDLYSWLIVLAMIAVGVALVFGVVVRRATSANAAKRAMVLAVLAVLSVAVFWTGLPVVFAGGAVCCALVEPRRIPSRITLALAALVAAAAVWAALAG